MSGPPRCESHSPVRITKHECEECRGPLYLVLIALRIPLCRVRGVATMDLTEKDWEDISLPGLVRVER